MMATHLPMAANMLAQFDRDMRSMNMTPDPRWNALADSIRQDLTRMPELTAQEMQSMMREYPVRMRRLMQMHRDMIKNM